ncbi:MAG: DNA mismatch repair endonuclease MutL, partial [Fretibacterium sp.]|nr:DNA mismatch repair endonuclease MutL [Fretibacterium sp.]
IRELPEGVWTRIAAGEVVERPASAVKELVENALDAGARRVRVRLWDGGRLRIVVEDDGCGISREDLPLALTPHATSKIRGVEDLEAIRTLGYRGEALASLTAVSAVEIRSRPEGSEAGGLIRTSGGSVVETRAVNCAPGTRVQVDELFGNLPARRKFLKSAGGELRRAAVLMREYAVCRPDVAFVLEHDGRQVLATEGGGEGEEGRRRVLGILWGAGPEIQRTEAAAAHLSLECWWQSRQTGIKGAVGRNDIMAFVNGRAVNDPLIRGAVSAAARELSGSWALFLSLDPSLVDVNIHPAKAEVRFRYPGEVFDAVRQAADQLGSPAFVALDGGEKGMREPRSRAAAMTRGWNFRDGQEVPVPEEQQEAASFPAAGGQDAASFPAAGGHFPSREKTEYIPPSGQNRQNKLFSGRPAPLSRGEVYGDAASFLFSRVEPPEFSENSLPDDPIYMGQTASGYLVFDAPDGLTLMDPHAAHERIGYERVRAQAQKEWTMQNLLVPVPLPPTLALEAVEHQKELEEAGFAFETKDGGTSLQAVPSCSAERVEPEALLRASLGALREEHDGDPRELLWRAWATIACKAAVKLTGKLSREEALTLWRNLHQCSQPFFCPHGRPTMLRMTSQDLVRHFGRG